MAWRIESDKFYGTEMNVAKTKVMRISRQLSPVLIKRDQKHQENVEYFNYLTRKSKSRVAIRKSSVQQKDYFHE
jgi:hypothetical protein